MEDINRLKVMLAEKNAQPSMDTLRDISSALEVNPRAPISTHVNK